MKVHYSIAMAFFIKINAAYSQTTFYSSYQVKTADSKPANITSPLLNAFTFPSPPKIENNDINRMNSQINEPNKSVEEIRVTGYYKEGYGEYATWKKMSLKVTVETDLYGRDKINVIAYKNSISDYWYTVSYGNPSKTYGDISEDFSYQVFVASTLVYFNL